MNKYVVRMVLPDGVHSLGNGVRWLLYLQSLAGLIAIHRDDAGGMCFDLLSPAGVTDSKAWADRMAAMCTEFHYNAVRAPEWVG